MVCRCRFFKFFYIFNKNSNKRLELKLEMNNLGERSIHEKKRNKLPLANGSTPLISMVGRGVPEALHLIVKLPPSIMEIFSSSGITWSIRAGTKIEKNWHVKVNSSRL